MADTQETTLRTVPLSEIDVEEGFDPRTRMDEVQLEGLIASVREHGILTPLLVTATEDDDGYKLVGGHRRYRAAGEAAVTEVPVIVHATSNGDALELATIDNLLREDLNPIDEARAYERIMAAGGYNQGELAEKLSIAPKRVSQRLALLKLPGGVQEHIAPGAVPPQTAKALKQIATVCEPLACNIAALIADGPASPAQFMDRSGDFVLDAVAGSDVVAVEVVWGRVALGELPLDDDARADADQRLASLPGRHDGWGGPTHMPVSADDLDAARAYGCLLELGSDHADARAFICDREFLADRATAWVAEEERHAAERVQRTSQTTPVATGADGEALSEEKAKEARREQRAAELAERVQARGLNLDLGRRLADKFHEPKITKDVARLLALLVFDREPGGLAGRGLRYVREDLQDVETKEIKATGEQREKVTYLDPVESQEALYESLSKARNAEQILGRVLQAMIAARWADETVVAQSKRSYYGLAGSYGGGASAEIPELIDKLAKRALPPQMTEKHNAA